MQLIHTSKYRDFCTDARLTLALKLSYLAKWSLDVLIMLDFNTIAKGELRADVIAHPEDCQDARRQVRLLIVRRHKN